MHHQRLLVLLAAVTLSLSVTTHAQSYDYDAAGRLILVRQGDTFTRYTYDTRGNITRVVTSNGPGPRIDSAMGAGPTGGSRVGPGSPEPPLGRGGPARSVRDSSARTAALPFAAGALCAHRYRRPWPAFSKD